MSYTIRSHCVINLLKYILNNLTFKYSCSYNRLSSVNYSSTVIDASLRSYLAYVYIYYNYYYYYRHYRPDRHTCDTGSHEFALLQHLLCYLPGMVACLLLSLCYSPANIRTSILLFAALRFNRPDHFFCLSFYFHRFRWL